jgi:hypothetical protein
LRGAEHCGQAHVAGGDHRCGGLNGSLELLTVRKHCELQRLKYYKDK